MFLLPIGISGSGVLVDWFSLAIAESVLLFAISIPSGYFRHSAQSHVSGTTELQDELSVSDALLEGANRLVI